MHSVSPCLREYLQTYLTRRPVMRLLLMCTAIVLLVVLSATEGMSHAAEGILSVAEPTEAALRVAFGEVRHRREGGDTQPLALLLPPGTYQLAETVRLDAAVVGEGLTVFAEPGTSATLSGARPLVSSSRDAEGNWRYRLPPGWDQHGMPRVMLVDELLQPAARSPNEGFFRIQQTLPDRRSGFRYDPRDIPPPLPLNGHVCDLVFLHDWSISRLPVSAIDPGTAVLRTTGPIGPGAAHFAIDHFERQPRYALEGHRSFADRAGEWYLDLSTQELVVVGEATSSSPPAVALPLLEHLIVAQGTDDAPLRNLELHNLSFTGTRFPMPPGGLACIQATHHEPRAAEGGVLDATWQILSAAVEISRGEGCLVRECTFTSLGNSALTVGSRTRNCRVEDCRIEHVGGNGVNLGEGSARRVDGHPWYAMAPAQVASDNSITGCSVSHCGRVLFGSVGIWGGFQREVEIVGNEVFACPYTGISLGWVWNPKITPAHGNRIAENHIHEVMQIMNDGGGIYILGRQGGSVIEDNTIEDVTINVGSAESNGIFMDQGTTGWTVRNNTFRRIARSPLRFHQAGHNTVTGNRWELATPDTPPVRFNNTRERNITIRNNSVLAE